MDVCTYVAKCKLFTLTCCVVLGVDVGGGGPKSGQGELRVFTGIVQKLISQGQQLQLPFEVKI